MSFDPNKPSSCENYSTQPTTCNPCVIPGTPLWDLFQQEGNCEAALFESLVDEFTNIAGFPIKYFISLANMDTLYGEDATNDYAEPITTKLIYEPTEEASIIESFGFRGDDVIQYAMIPKLTLNQALGPMFYTYHPSGDIVQPYVGDIITTTWNNRNYEIVDIGSEERIFQGTKPMWELILRPYRYGSESKKAKEIHMPDNIDEIEIIDEEMEDTPGVEDRDYPTVKYGDNSWIEDESNDIDPYDDVDKGIFGL